MKKLNLVSLSAFVGAILLGSCRSIPLAEKNAKLARIRYHALPATGQTECYGSAGNKIPCADAICPGQDGIYKAGCPNDGRFLDNQDGTVTDNCTGLMWQKDTADVNNDGRDVLPLCKALAYCESMAFADHDDWRLPNVRELLSIVDYGWFNPSIDPVFGAVSGRYWSSSTVVDFPSDAWSVGFSVGLVGDSGVHRGSPLFVRAVRNAP